MTDLPRFKLIFLPLLVYEAVLQKMNVREQYKLATVSKRMQCGVCKSNRVGVVTCSVHFYSESLSFVVTHERTRSRFVYSLRPNERDNYISLAKKQIVFLKNSLRLQAVDLDFSETSPENIEFDFIPFLKQENLRIRDIEVVSNDEYHDESFEYLLNEGKDCRKLELGMDISPNFRTSPCPVFSVDKFYSPAGSWVTVDELVKNFMNCKEIDLGDFQCTPQQLNPFIKRWTEGSRIEDFCFNLTDVSHFEAIVNGIDATEVRQAFIRYGGRQSFEPNECFLIKQSSGVTALLYVKNQNVVLNTNFSLDSPLVESPDTADYSYDDDEDSEDRENKESDKEDSELHDEEANESEQDEEEEADDEAFEGEEEEEDVESDE